MEKNKSKEKGKVKSKIKQKEKRYSAIYIPPLSDEQIEQDNAEDLFDGTQSAVSLDDKSDETIHTEVEPSLHHDDDDPGFTENSFFDDSIDVPEEDSPFVEYTTVLRFVKDEQIGKYIYIPIARTFNGYHDSRDQADQRGYAALERSQIINMLGKWIEDNRQEFLESFKIKDLAINAYNEIINNHYPCIQSGLLKWLLEENLDINEEEKPDINQEKNQNKNREATFSRYLNDMAISCNGLEMKIDVFFSKEAKIAWAAMAYYSVLEELFKDFTWSRKWQEERLEESLGRKKKKCIIDVFKVSQKDKTIPDTIIDKKTKGKITLIAPSKAALCIMKKLSVKFSDICDFLDKEIGQSKEVGE